MQTLQQIQENLGENWKLIKNDSRNWPNDYILYRDQTHNLELRIADDRKVYIDFVRIDRRSLPKYLIDRYHKESREYGYDGGGTTTIFRNGEYIFQGPGYDLGNKWILEDIREHFADQTFFSRHTDYLYIPFYIMPYVFPYAAGVLWISLFCNRIIIATKKHRWRNLVQGGFIERSVLRIYIFLGLWLVVYLISMILGNAITY